MNARGFAGLDLLLYALTAALAVGATYAFLEKRCNSACKDMAEKYAGAERRVKALEAEKVAAQDRATAMALLAAQRLEATDRAVRANQEKNDATIATLDARARALRGRLVRVSADAARLLADAAVAANAGNATPAEVDHGPAPAVPDSAAPGSLVVFDEGELTAWGVRAGAAYLSCRTKWAACVTAYEQVRTANQPGAPPP